MAAMGLSLAEIALAVAAVALVYKLLAPLQRRIEAWLLDRLIPGRKRVIDVRDEKEK
jgi:hypothetical protein